MSGTAETRIENAVADLNRQIAQAPLPEAPVRAPMRWGRALAAGSAIALALAAIVFLAPAGPQPTPAATTTPSTSTSLVGSLPSEGPVFGEPTGVLLLFDDGIDGLTAVDLDRRLAGRSVVEGQRAGMSATRWSGLVRSWWWGGASHTPWTSPPGTRVRSGQPRSSSLLPSPVECG